MRKRTKAAPTQARVRRHIADLIGRLRREGRERLPTIAGLARECGVSPVTVHRVIRALCNEGALRATPRSGIRLASGRPRSQPNPGSPPPQSRHDYLLQRLQSDIASGRFASGTLLPPYKVMSRRYGVGSALLKRCLELLVNEERIVPYKRGYRVGRERQERSVGTVVVISRTGPIGSIEESPERRRRLLLELESACRRRNLRVQSMSVTVALGIQPLEDGRRHGIEELEQHRTVLGYMVLTTGLLDTELDGLLHTLQATDKPVAVVDEITPTPLDDLNRRLPGTGKFGLFALERGRQSGVHVAEYLTNRGHTALACFGYEYSIAWSGKRMEGVREVFAARGMEGTLTLVRLADAPGAMPPNAAAYQSLEKHFTTYAKQANPHFREGPPGPYRKERLARSLQDLHLFAALRPQLEATRRSCPARAWLFLNDHLGLMGYRYLMSKTVAVPGTVSIMGMDNTLSGFSSGLTSYDFRVDRLVVQVVEHLLQSKGPGVSARANPAPCIIAGVVVERETVRRLARD